ncbi:MAG: PDZ domain-containing protein [Planctomycetes bacterium]|nr:PDZ domain-containing protein [Planctomycetota bacterium]
MSDGYDRTPEGEQVIALLRRLAPPSPDSTAGARAVMSRLRSSRDVPNAAGRLHFLKIAGPVAAVLAASIVIALFIMTPRHDPIDTFPYVGNRTPASQPAAPMQFFTVRASDGNRVVLDSGLTTGLRNGDLLTGAGGASVRVTAVGIFFAHGIIESGAPVAGQRLGCEATPAMFAATKALEIGGDPGALFDFGAVLRNLPPQQARARGLMGGKGLMVVEVVPAISREIGNPKAEVTTAGQLGLQQDDLILSVNGFTVSDLSDLTKALEATRRGGALRMLILRNQKEVQLVID